jgi:phenylpyruvate tautomerase PptA (4-oxalocrotonate tautomerase family)
VSEFLDAKYVAGHHGLSANLTDLHAALLAGDRSLVDVVVHELTHSWFGNGVTWVSIFESHTSHG